MEHEKDFSSLLTWLGIVLGLLILGAAILAIFRLSYRGNYYPCVPMPAENDQGNYTLAFHNEANKRPNLRLTFVSPKEHGVCRVASGNTNEIKSWRVLPAAQLKPDTKVSDFNILIQKDPTPGTPEARRERFRQQIERGMRNKDVLRNFDWQGFTGLELKYQRGDTQWVQYEFTIGQEFTLLIFGKQSDPAVGAALDNLKVLYEPAT